MKFIAVIVLVATSLTVTKASSGAHSCRSTLKKGRCPPTPINPSEKECVSSDECEGNQLCCYDADKRSRCSDPLETKSNECPPPQNTSHTSDATCYLDSDCPGDKKCCRHTSCEQTCVDSKKSNVIIKTRQTRAIKCLNDIPDEARCPAQPIGDATSCNSNSDCPSAAYSMCCADKTGAKFCSEPYSDRRDLGVCPGSMTPEFDANGEDCLLDSNCPANKRCCPNSDNCLTCQYVKPSTSVNQCFSIEKRGVCPVANVGKTTCSSHAQCPGNQMCCRRSTGTDFRCSDPFTDRTGKCPTRGSIVASKSCFLDSDCARGEKCCALRNCTYYCTAVSSLPDPLYCESNLKRGVCPNNRINPSKSCEAHIDCPGRQLCCDRVCSDPSTTKRGNCPAPNQVPRGPSYCITDENCTGAPDRKCCADANCDYYCTWSVT